MQAYLQRSHRPHTRVCRDASPQTRIWGERTQDNLAQTADPLFYLHGIPGETEITNAVSELKVAVFAPSLRIKQETGRAAELLNSCFFFQSRQPSVEYRYVVPGASVSQRLQQLLSGAELGEETILSLTSSSKLTSPLTLVFSC